MNALMEKVFKILNLKGHWTGLGEQLKWIHGPCDIEGKSYALYWIIYLLVMQVIGPKTESSILLTQQGFGLVKHLTKGIFSPSTPSPPSHGGSRVCGNICRIYADSCVP